MEVGLVRTLLLCCLFSSSYTQDESTSASKDELLVMTVATDANDGFSRFIKSTKKHGLDVEVLGMGEKWEGGDMEHGAGGGQKINLLLNALKKYKHRDDLLVMFVDSYDLVVTSDKADILAAFRKFDAKVVFSAEGFCWPDASLVSSYPTVKMNEKRFLNSGGFIGYATQLYEIVSSSPVKSDDDDQLYYTNIFLSPEMREKLSIKLDTRSEIFQNLNGALDEVQLKFKGATSYMYNSKTGNIPMVIHGNGPIKPEFNRITNYIGDQWTPTHGCLGCKEGTISLEGMPEEYMPEVMVAIFIETPVSFLDIFFKKIATLSYPKSRIDLFVHNNFGVHRDVVAQFRSQYANEYKSANFLTPDSKLSDKSARNRAVDECVKRSCQYLFTIDGDSQLTNPDTIKLLIERNRTVIGPLLTRQGKLWSNFWGALSSEGYYKRSDDYLDIVLQRRRGIWNVPHLSQAMLIQGHKVPSLAGKYINGAWDQDMALSKSLRELGIFMHVDNSVDYGFLTNSENFQLTRKHSDLYSIFDNQQLWEEKYLHEEHYSYVAKNFSEYLQPCTDVFWMPLGSPTFCQHLIEEMEHFGQWSGGGHEARQDPRLGGGGYENVPTVDIHTNQIGWEPHWLHILRHYVAPFNAKVFAGYYTESRASMNFVVRYKKKEQDRLKPHSDSSTYTVNVALNKPGIDYEGGGVRFIRYNCSVTNTRMGWLLMHPGRLTHHHEGLPTTGGTRYIMVSFIDP